MVVAPRLANVGFRHRDTLVFHRPVGRFIQVIEFAAHPPGSERFTVRLGVYLPFAPDVNGEPRDPSEIAGVTRCQLRASLGRILYGKEFIWKTSAEWDETYRQMRDALRGILACGLGWLAKSTDLTVLLRYYVREASRSEPSARGCQLPAAEMLGLLHEAREEPEHARVAYRQALSDVSLTRSGLREWLCNRLHNLPV